MSFEFELFLWIVIIFSAFIIIWYRILVATGVVKNGRFCKRNNKR
jgi:hypothetical protein